MEIRFHDNTHEEFYQEFLAKMKCHDCYHQVLAYLLSLDVVCRKHIFSLFDFEEDRIKPDGLHEAWQTGTSMRTSRLAFNLWNGYCTDGENGIDKDGYEIPLISRYYAVDYIFCCSYAPYYYEAIRLRYPECT